MTYKFSSNNFQGNRRPFSKVWSYQLRKSCNNLCSVPSSSTILLVLSALFLSNFLYTIFITSPNFTILNSSIYHPFKYILVFFSFLRFFSFDTFQFIQKYGGSHGKMMSCRLILQRKVEKSCTSWNRLFVRPENKRNTIS